MPTPEEQARQKIHQLLEAAGWQVQDRKALNLRAAQGVAVREFPLQTGFADYLLFMDRKAVGVIEAKPWAKALWIYDLRQHPLYPEAEPAHPV